jgi:hypothetical protein
VAERAGAPDDDPENAAPTLEAFYNLDVSALAGQVCVPTLVMHSRGDARVPFDEGRKLATMIHGARFVPLESCNHVLVENEAAWPAFMAEVRDFLATMRERGHLQRGHGLAGHQHGRLRGGTSAGHCKGRTRNDAWRTFSLKL